MCNINCFDKEICNGTEKSSEVWSTIRAEELLLADKYLIQLEKIRK